MSGSRSGLVAVLFTDLVGSTEQMSQLGHRAFDDLRRRHFAALGAAVATHGGEEVKNTGEGLMAVFPSAAEPVEAAVAMQQATARQAKTSPLAIRAGVAVGDATFEGSDYFGTPLHQGRAELALAVGDQATHDNELSTAHRLSLDVSAAGHGRRLEAEVTTRPAR